MQFNSYPYFRIILFQLILVFFVGCKSTMPVTKEVNEQSEEELATEQSPELETYPEPRVYKPERTKEHDLLHTKLVVSFDWANQFLHGIATLELTPYFYPQNSLELDAKGFDIDYIHLLDADQKKPLDYEYDGMKINISLDREYTRGEKYLLEIKYTAKPNELEEGGSEAITSDKGLYFINPLGTDPDKPQQIWTQGETESSSCWFPTIDAPNEKTTQEIYMTVEDRFVTLSNGLLISSTKNEDGTRTDYWKLDLPHAPYLFMMAVGEFAIVKDTWEDLEVTYYVEPEYEEYADDIFGNTPEMMTFFSEMLGYKFPWPKYAQIVVRDYVSGAMENTSASVYMEELQVDDRELIDYHWDDIIAHELFHQWIGDLLTCESWANLPMNEAFANYSEYLWKEHKYGIEEAEYHNLQELNKYLEESERKEVDLIRFYYDDPDDMFDSHSYAKGGRVLHMLRKYLGDEAFFAGLKYYVNENDFEDVEIHDFRLAMEEVSGEDLNWFFNQWFLASGHPEIKVAHSYDSGNFKIEIWQLQDPKTTPIYKLPVKLQVFLDDRPITYDLLIEDSYQQFNFKYQKEPNLLIFDGDQYLLADIDHQKSHEEYIFQYYHSDQFLARYRAVEHLMENPKKNKNVLLDAFKDSSWAIRELAISAFEDYKAESMSMLESALRDVATSDQNSLVRADALNALATISIDNNLDVFKNALNDSSYSVLGTALYSYAESNADTAEKLSVLKNYEDLDNINIVFPLANYYSQIDADRYDWFERKLQSLSGTDLWYMLQFFGEYLMNAKPNEQRKGAEILENKARKSQSYYIRLAAYQALGLLEELEGVDKIREDIRNSETDSRLNQIYMNME